MIDKQLIGLLGENKKRLISVISYMILGFIANVSITASICSMIYFAYEYEKLNLVSISVLILLHIQIVIHHIIVI